MTTEPATTVPGPDEPDVLGMQIAHRAMLRDLDRTTGIALAMADGTVPITGRRTRMLVRYLELLAESIHHHHRAEDDILWPVIEDRAGGHIDLAPLTEDHEALVPELEALRGATAALRAHPGRPAARALATKLAEMRDMLGEHICEEERDTFPAIRRYLSVADWRDVEARIRRCARMSFELPRIAAASTPAELAVLKRDAGPLIAIMLAAVGPRYRRMERAVWGRDQR
ncbi:MAG: hemerythrin domain-containing protein [Actinomycetota bacterium]|nr:hemerythrin domain-containing protein [Actinomycetota bacterium]